MKGITHVQLVIELERKEKFRADKDVNVISHFVESSEESVVCPDNSYAPAANGNMEQFNSLPTNDGKCSHDLCELFISLWEFIWGF